MSSPRSRAPTGLDDGTEINNVDLATRENSNKAAMAEGGMGGGAPAAGFPPTPWLSGTELMSEE